MRYLINIFKLAYDLEPITLADIKYQACQVSCYLFEAKY